MSGHIPVLLPQIIDALQPENGTVERLVDGTLGAGGHTRALLEAGVKDVLAMDLDPVAVAAARHHLAPFGDRVSFCCCSYLQMQQQALARGWNKVDAILLDLGLSSLQLDDPARGFAFRHPGPLDMRFDQSADLQTAHDLVNTLAEDDLAQLFFRYGEESAARHFAREIIQRRPITSTDELAQLITAVTIGRRRRAKIHPATKVFQALRIAVNRELEAVEQILPIAIDLLRPGGRLAVITFHSLEDRIVKRAFRDMASETISPPGMASIIEKAALVRLVNRKPIRADAEEIANNPRSRSAKLRVAEKLESG